MIKKLPNSVKPSIRVSKDIENVYSVEHLEKKAIYIDIGVPLITKKDTVRLFTHEVFDIFLEDNLKKVEYFSEIYQYRY